MKTHVAALGVSTVAAASVLAWRAATTHHRDDRALAAWLHFTNANNLQSVVSNFWAVKRGGNSASSSSSADDDAAAGARPSHPAPASGDGGSAGSFGGGSGAAGTRFRKDDGGADAEEEKKEKEKEEGAGVATASKDSSTLLPDDFICPIGAFVMIDPVLCGCTASCGKSFDRRSIERWVTLGAGTCPHTGR